MCELNIYLCFRMLQSQEVKEEKKSSSLCNHIFLSLECFINYDFSSFESLCRKVKRLDQSHDHFPFYFPKYLLR